MNLKKGLFLVLAIGFMARFARAELTEIPRDNQNTNPGDINLIGVDVFVATGTTSIGSTVPVILYGYSVSSDAITNYALLRDSNTLNTSSNIKLTLYPDAYCTSTAQTCTAKFPQPIIFRNGLSINLNSQVANGALGTKGRWMFYLRYRDYGTKPGRQPPFSVDNLGVN